MIEWVALHCKKLLAAAVWVAVALPVLPQNKAPAYEVISVKQNKSGSSMMRINTGDDRFFWRRVLF
jgi:hypothetical protein